MRLLVRVALVVNCFFLAGNLITENYGWATLNFVGLLCCIGSIILEDEL